MTFDDSVGPKQVATLLLLGNNINSSNLRSSRKLILQTFPIHAGICTIGKSSADIVLDDDAIADEHAMIQASDFGPHFIQDVSGHGVKFRFDGGDFNLLPNRFYEIRERKEIIMGNSLLLYESLVDPIDSLVVSTNTTTVNQNDHHEIVHNRNLTDGSPSLLDDSIDSDFKERQHEAIDGTPYKLMPLIRQTADHSPECSLSILGTKIFANKASGPSSGVSVARNLSIGDDADTETVIDEAPARPLLSDSHEWSTEAKTYSNRSLSAAINKNMSDMAYHKNISFDSLNEDNRREDDVDNRDKNNEEQESFFVVGQTQTGADALLALSRNSSFFGTTEFTHDEETPPSDDQCSVVSEYSSLENTKPRTIRTYKSRNSASKRSTLDVLDEFVESENDIHQRNTKHKVENVANGSSLQDVTLNSLHNETSSENDVRPVTKELSKSRGPSRKQEQQRIANPVHRDDEIFEISTHTIGSSGLDASPYNEKCSNRDVDSIPKTGLKLKKRRPGKKSFAKCDRISKGREILNESTAFEVESTVHSVGSGSHAEIIKPKMTEIKNPTVMGEVAVRSGKKTATSALRKVETSDTTKLAVTDKDPIQPSSVSKISDSNSFIPEKESMRYHDEVTSANQKPSKKEVSTAGKVSKRKASSDTKESQSKKLKKAESDIQTQIKNSKYPFTIMLTGFNPEMTNSLIRHIQTLKGAVTDNYNRCNILVTDKVRRTVKFLSALAAGLDIVSVDWLTDSISTGSFLDPSAYLLNDVASEEKYKFSLKQSLERAKTRKLFDGLSIFVTPKTLPKRDEMAVIIQASGGNLVKKTPTIAPEVSDKFMVIGCPEDMSLLKKLSRLGYTVVSNEFVLTGVLRQEKDPESFLLNLEDISHIPFKRARRK